ncbi:MAG TPA: protein kinase [Vicinamibacterales bacterium]|nr:protein kinase [Vicinamibacterales bacterium]
MALVAGRERLERLPLHAWAVIAIVLLSLLYTAVQVALVRPYLWPAGAGILLEGDPAARLPLLARPPEIESALAGPPRVVMVSEASPAFTAGVRDGDAVTAIRRRDGTRQVTFAEAAGAGDRVDAWRELYWVGVSDTVAVTLGREGAMRTLELPRPTARGSAATGWARRHLGVLVQTAVFTGAALVLLLLRSHDLTAGLCVLALALSGVAAGGPLLGGEASIPLGRVLTVFAWIASPLAFPVIALAIFYFPARSPLLVRHPWIHVVPPLAAAAMILPALFTGLYLSGADRFRSAAVWDASHPEVYFASFAIALGINVLAVLEGIYRYRFNHDANERRRIRMAVYTTVPGVFAYAVRDGTPVVAGLFGAPAPVFPAPVALVLGALVLMPAFGLVYAVGVARVLGPRVVLRRSLQYALASRTLSVVAMLPAAALAVALVQDRHRTIGEIASGRAVVYGALLLAMAGAWRYRERARQWLDQRFFRAEYDARKILLSLVSRVRFETDPADLASMVLNQLDEALHPQMLAILVSGVDEGRLTPVAVLHGSAESLPLEGGIVSMLRWSDEPLEIFLHDPRSAAVRLPVDEREWLECTGASLLVPVAGDDRTLIAVIVLGERRSEDAYTAEDRQLLASIAAQMALGFDVARLRRRLGSRAERDPDATHLSTGVVRPMAECPRCGRCEEPGVSVCPSDGSAMRPVPGVPRTVDNKYRLEQLLGRGGMGAVYRARDMRLDRLVAVKVVRAELLGDHEARRRFRREAQIVARLQHPSIVSVYDYGTFPDGGAYLVMELVRGEDLRCVLQREGRIEPARALRILVAVCDAIEAAHREGVLHRDLKPENILLPGGSVDVKVLDFGVAKVIADDRRDAQIPHPDGPTVLTAAGVIIGTPAYMAPEQFRGAEPGARTDVFSLGVIAYEMLSGNLPFGRGSLADVVLAQTRGVPPMAGAGISPAAERAIRTALDPDPDRRPASAEAFAHLLSATMGLD